MNIPQPAFLCVLDTSLRVSIVIGLVVLLRPVARRFAGNGVLPWLWLIVAARLLLPWPVHAPWPTLNPSWAAMPDASVGTVASSQAVRVSVADRTGPDASPPRHAEQAASMASPRGVFWGWIWMAGMLTALLRCASGWRQTRLWAAQTGAVPDDPGLQTAFESIPASWRRGVTCRVTDALAVPTLVGIVRPQIWVPRRCVETLDPAELRHVLLHELGHARRRDLLAQWIWALACCLHWFNPLVWVAARLARTDRELACDAWVLSRGDAGDGENTARAYGGTLLKVVHGLRTVTARTPAPAGVAMAAGRGNLALRVQHIVSFRRVSAWRTFGTAALGAVVIAVFSVNGGEPPSSPAGSAQPTPAVPPTSAPSPSPTGPTPKAATVHLEFEPRMVSLSRAAVRRLAAKKGELPGLEPVIDALAASFDQPRPDDHPAASFSVTQILTPAVYLKLLQKFNQTEGVDLLSAPRVTTRPEQKAIIEIIQDFIYPTKFERSDVPGGTPAMKPTKFEKKNVGLTLDVEAGVSPQLDKIDLTVKWQLAELEGWVNSEGKPVPNQNAMGAVARPVFSTRSIETAVTMGVGTTLLLGNPRRLQGAWRVQQGELKSPDEDNIVLNFITVRLVEAAGNVGANPPPPSPTPEASNPLSSETPGPEASGTSSLPKGKKVPGKPGYVTSPYAPEAGYVDLRGFESGAEVRDPYSGKLFQAP